MSELTREQWLTERRKGVGSSDAAPVCGLSPWATPLEVYLRKIGELPEQESSPAMDWGLRLEAAIAAAYEETTGRALRPPLTPIARHPELGWMLASLDRISWPAGTKPRVVELKTASAYHTEEWGEPGTDQVPEAYVCQVQHQLAVTGWQTADVAVLIGGSDFRVYTVPRNERLIDRLVEIEADFWRRVQERQPPLPDFTHPSTPALVASMHGWGEHLAVELGQEELDLAVQYEFLSVEARATERDREAIKAQLLHAMGPAAIGRLPGGVKLLRRPVSRKGYTVGESTYVQFSIRKPREKPNEA